MEFYRGLPDLSLSPFLAADRLSLIFSERYHLMFKPEHTEAAPGIFCDSDDTKQLESINADIKMSFPLVETEYVDKNRLVILNTAAIYTSIRDTEMVVSSHHCVSPNHTNIYIVRVQHTDMYNMYGMSMYGLALLPKPGLIRLSKQHYT